MVGVSPKQVRTKKMDSADAVAAAATPKKQIIRKSLPQAADVAQQAKRVAFHSKLDQGAREKDKSPRTPKATRPSLSAGPESGSSAPASSQHTPVKRHSEDSPDANDEFSTPHGTGKKKRPLFASPKEEKEWDNKAKEWKESFIEYINDVDGIEL
ncbi:hypothetical protein DIPPA_02495 [Diplonema papillatum]|nr:hypothetical protein DIPPA_02495 [Diplonema papillatum]